MAWIRSTPWLGLHEQARAQKNGSSCIPPCVCILSESFSNPSRGSPVEAVSLTGKESGGEGNSDGGGRMMRDRGRHRRRTALAFDADQPCREGQAAALLTPRSCPDTARRRWAEEGRGQRSGLDRLSSAGGGRLASSCFRLLSALVLATTMHPSTLMAELCARAEPDSPQVRIARSVGRSVGL